jgi:hypothetical protein
MIAVEFGPGVGGRECANDLSGSAADGGTDAILNSENFIENHSRLELGW